MSFSFAVCGQDADLAQQRCRLIDADEVLPAAVEQQISTLGGRFALPLHRTPRAVTDSVTTVLRSV